MLFFFNHSSTQTTNLNKFRHVLDSLDEKFYLGLEHKSSRSGAHQGIGGQVASQEKYWFIKNAKQKHFQSIFHNFVPNN